MDRVLEDSVTALITGEARISSSLLQEPETALIPYKGTRERFFLLVNLVLRPHILDFVTVSFVARRVTELALRGHGVCALPAVETALYIPYENRITRILRLGVFSEAYKYVSKLTDDDLIREPLYPGIKCWWSVDKPETITDCISMKREDL
ncbi:MAG TPA: hypothetical protein VGP72_31250 [Planctomycetota bacterium]|jgi:hypothetical protein